VKLIFAVLCVTQWRALHVAIKRQFFYIYYDLNFKLNDSGLLTACAAYVQYIGIYRCKPALPSTDTLSVDACCRLGAVLTTAGNVFAACSSVERLLTLLTRGSAAL